ncbi:MAG: AraC family transcriptional regulator [Povalibacter sp.]
MPDISPVNTQFRSWFYARWGRENCIILGRSRDAQYATFKQRLSIKMAFGGTERYFVDGRSVAVDDESYLVLNDNRCYGSSIDATNEVESFSIFFRPGFMEEMFGAASTPVNRICEPHSSRSVEFCERLQPQDATVTPVMRFIRHHIERGVSDEAWYEEQLQVLAARLLLQQRRIRRQSLRLDCVKISTRQELQRRLGLATDYILSNYERELTLEQMASAACLSSFHFMRLFQRMHGLTPLQFLYRKRIQVAVRLQRRGDVRMQDIASLVGFNSRATFYRQLRRWQHVASWNVEAPLT